MKLGRVSAVFVTLICLSSILLFTVSGASPPNPPTRPMQFIEDTAGAPSTVDPSFAYDSASGEMIFNVYDTLIQFNVEHVDQYIGDVADQWWSQNITGTMSPAGIPWYWRYTFHMKPGIHFAAPYNYTLTTEDIQYSFWRTMILDANGGPEWMLNEPLLNNAAGPNYLGNMAVETDVSRVGNYIDQSVGRNDSYVWFNIAYPAAYGPFLQIVSQTWSSIMSKQYINNQIIGAANSTNDWSGNWAALSTTKYPSWTMNHTGWIDQFDVYTGTTGPLDRNGAHMYGSGPFMLTNLDFTDHFWTMMRNPAYFRGWPADFPVLATVGPAGYCDVIRENFGVGTTARIADLLSGACDFTAVPRNHIGDVYQNSTPPFNPPTNYPQNGIRVTPALPTLQVDVMYFTFDIDPATLYGPIYSPGVYGPNGIPSDFFSNAVTGIHVRKAFAYAFDHASYIATAFYGEAQHVYTALIPGLPYYDPSVIGYNYNPAAAAAEFAQVPGIMANGFNVTILWNTGNLARQTAAQLLQSGLAAINVTFVATPVELGFSTMLNAIARHQAPVFKMSWLADYPDMHDFAQPFYSGVGGTFPIWANWDNATLDADIDLGIQTADGPARQAVYTKLAKDVIAFCPCVALEQPIDRHFERDWVQGWYYNANYPYNSGVYYYNLWKWYYAPQAFSNPPTQPVSDQLGADVNYDGKVDGKDIATAARCFGARRGPPIDPIWNFRCDVNLDGIIDMKDIAYVAKYFNPPRVTDKWVPTP